MELKQFVDNFSEQLENEEGIEIGGEVKFRDLAEWDSLVALSIIAMADEKYGFKLTGDDIKSSVTVADLFQKISAKNS